MSADVALNHLRSLNRKGRVVPVIGSGFSVWTSSNAPSASWTGLLRTAVQYARDHVEDLDEANILDFEKIVSSGADADTLTTLAGRLETILGGRASSTFRQWLQETTGQLRVKHREFFEPLEKLGPLYLTTNYDSLLEQALGGPALTWLDREQVHQVILGDNYGIIHVHGYWESPQSLVLGPESYESVSKDPFTQAMLRHLIFGKALLFIGFGAGLQDRNFSQLRDWMREWTRHSCYAHFRLIRASEEEETRRAHADDVRIVPIVYGDDYADLPVFLESLTAADSAPAKKSVRWRTLEDFRFALLSNSQAQREFFIRELALAALYTVGTASPAEFAVLYKTGVEVRSGCAFPTNDLLCHKVAFINCLRERVIAFISELQTIREGPGSPADANRIYAERLKRDAEIAEGWSFRSRLEPAYQFRTFTVAVDPERKEVLISSDENSSLNVLTYKTKGKSTSDALRYIAACLNQSEFAIIENLFEGLLEAPGLTDIVVDFLDKTGIDLKALRINAADEEKWVYLNVRFKKETGEFFDSNAG